MYYSTNPDSYNMRILGDATGELGPFELSTITDRKASSWFNSYSYFVYEYDPFFIRCGPLRSETSEHNLTIHTSGWGGGGYNQSFRIILTPST